MAYRDSDVESDIEYIEDDEEDDDATEEEKDIAKLVQNIKKGFVKDVKQILDEKGDVLAPMRDKDGHTLIHWAALGGYNDVCEWLLEKGCPLNDQSENDYGPRPIHWACVNGHVVTVDMFMEKGVHIDTTDRNGCSPLLIAAQYGQSLLISYLLQKGANKFHTDINNDSALHWASFKGFPEVAFLLINAGLSPSLKDSYGQTPMHSACIKGDLQIAEMLMDHGVSVDDPDSNGKTPRMLAEKRRHHRLLTFLDNKDVPTHLFDWRTWVFGPPGRSRYAVLFFVLFILLYGYPMYIWKGYPLTIEVIPTVHKLFWVGNVVMWILYIYLKTGNPGYIKQNRAAFDEALKMIGNPTAWGEYNDMHNPVYNMCHTCKTVRPIRSKHCRQCDRCVDHFDHHCPWIDNCVGRANRVPFLIFVDVMFVNGCLIYLMVYNVLQVTGGFLVYFGVTTLVFFSMPVGFMICYTHLMIGRNMTTNERANYRRYRHFRDNHGNFRNPFYRGIVANVLEYFNLVEPPYIKSARSRSSDTFIV